MPDALTILFAGSGAFGLPTLRALVADPSVRLTHVYTQPDRPAGRGRRLTPTPIGGFAEEHALPLTKTDRLNGLAPLPAADLLVVIAFGQKLAASVVDAPRLGGINLHASILPRHRGAAPIHHALLAGDRVTGNSVIRLADVMDAGDVLATSEIPIGETDTVGDLHDRLADDGATLVRQVIDDLRTGLAIEMPQSSGLVTLAPKLGRGLAIVDFSRSAFEVTRRINGLSPWPGCAADVTGADGTPAGRVTLLRARPLSPGDAADGPPGTILPDGTIATPDGRVEVLEVTPPGRRTMPLTDYRRGHPWPAGGRVG